MVSPGKDELVVERYRRELRRPTGSSLPLAGRVGKGVLIKTYDTWPRKGGGVAST
jgi:hypothetical protein